jgi:hypothetical protein
VHTLFSLLPCLCANCPDLLKPGVQTPSSFCQFTHLEFISKWKGRQKLTRPIVGIRRTRDLSQGKEDSKDSKGRKDSNKNLSHFPLLKPPFKVSPREQDTSSCPITVHQSGP